MKVRAKCTDANGNWHYIYEEQNPVDQNITCTEHPSDTVNDFVIVTQDIL